MNQTLKPAVRTEMHDRGTGSSRAFATLARLLVYFILAIALFITLAPMIWVIMSSLKDSTHIVVSPLSLPNPPAWRNYTYAWQVGHIGTYFRNSIYITTSSTLLVVVASTLAGHALARLKFFGRDVVFIVILLGLMIPAEVVMVPLFFQMRDMGWLNNPLSVIFTYTALVIPVGVSVMRAFFANIHQEIEDVARIDGCNDIQLFLRVMLPMATSGVVSLSILASVWSWNDFTLPFLFLSKTGDRTLPVAIVAFEGDFGEIILGPLFAASALTFLPILTAYVVLQRRFIQGITQGAIKG